MRKYSFCHFPLAPHYLKRGIPVSNVLHEVTKGTTDVVATTLEFFSNLIIKNDYLIFITVVVESFGAPRMLTVKLCCTVSLLAYKLLKSL